jgi:signal transduction histidine kinase
VREIALASRGSVSVDAGEGGTTFCVRLPLASAAPD